MPRVPGVNAIHHRPGRAAGPSRWQRPPRDVERGGFVFREVVSGDAAASEWPGPERRARALSELNLNVRFAPGPDPRGGRGRAALASGGGPGGGDGDQIAPPREPVCFRQPALSSGAARRDRRLRAPGPSEAWTDVARFGAFGVDAVNYGPGETAQAHQAGETADIAALAAAYRKLERFLTAAG
mgnify:CR=1 FL=1